MESTGVFDPLYDFLASRGFEVLLVDPRQTKHAPGRPKSDVVDCQWIRRLHSYGLLTGSFRPPTRSFAGEACSGSVRC